MDRKQTMEIKEIDIQAGLWRLFVSHRYRFLNTYFFKNESDFISFSMSGYSYDIEVKVSKSDYRADFAKSRHAKMALLFQGKEYCVKRVYTNTKAYASYLGRYNHREGKFTGKRPAEVYCSKIDFVKNENIANRFYFAVPEDMVSVEEVPEYAGLIYFYIKGGHRYCKIIKKAPLLHKEKKDPTKLFNKMYLNYEEVVRKLLFK